VAVYSGAWQEVIPPDVNNIGLAPSELRWQDGTLYYRAPDVPMTIQALPVGNGVAPTPRILTSEDSFRIWIEGDRVLYSQGEVLRAIPTAGGTPVTVLAGPDTFGNGANQILYASDQDLVADYYYYDTWRNTPGAEGETWNVWRLPRAGGDPEKLAEATTTAPEYLERFEHGPNGILAANTGGSWFVPYDGQGVRELPVGGWMLIGMDGNNVLWSRIASATAANDEVFQVWRVTPDAPDPTLLWAPAPNIGPESAFPDGAGGWLIAAIEYFSDQLIHTSVWHLDAAGNATRLAANPEPHQELIASMVVAPDAIYAGLDSFDDPASWTILRFPALTAPASPAEPAPLISAARPATAAPFAVANAITRHTALLRAAIR
jgi:hypothetical protein